MRIFVSFLLAAVMVGCAGRRYASYSDSYEAVQVVQMRGNNVSAKPVQRTILCLNARRETRMVHGFTNVNVVFVTNATVVTLTNQSITVITNLSRTLATNVIALPPAPSVTATNEAAPADTNVVVVAAASPSSTNESVTTANNVTLSRAGNQISSVANLQTQTSRQITVSSNNVSITTADNQVATAETNLVLIVQTNLTIFPVTNVVVVETNLPHHEYFLFTELTPPPDFSLQSGESLVLLVDGVRHVFAPVNNPAFIANRKGFLTTLYRVPPEVLVDIANAQTVDIRLRGVNSAIDRTMSASSRKAFKKYLLKYFTPPSPGTNAEPQLTARVF